MSSLWVKINYSAMASMLKSMREKERIAQNSLTSISGHIRFLETALDKAVQQGKVDLNDRSNPTMDSNP
jgi:hypothetical protein